MAKGEGLRTGQVLAALREKFALPAFALFTEVGDATGWAKSRSADALAMGCWPSRGLDLYGFEIKVSRSDWKKELDNPAKAESICRYCDFWYVCCGARGIVKEGELPPTWGLMEPHGTKLVVRKEAPRLKAEDWDRGFLAALLRRARETNEDENAIKVAADRARGDGYRSGYEEGQKVAGREMKAALHRAESIEQQVRAFEAASGITLDRWANGRALGEAVKLVAQGGLGVLDHRIEQFERTANEVLRIVERLKTAAHGARPAEESLSREASA